MKYYPNVKCFIAYSPCTMRMGSPGLSPGPTALEATHLQLPLCLSVTLSITRSERWSPDSCFDLMEQLQERAMPEVIKKTFIKLWKVILFGKKINSKKMNRCYRITVKKNIRYSQRKVCSQETRKAWILEDNAKWELLKSLVPYLLLKCA